MIFENPHAETNGGVSIPHGRIVATVILYAFALRLIFAVITPAWQAPDEFAHFWYAENLSTLHRFPSVSGDFPGYEAFQPPIYYAIASVVVMVVPGNQSFTFDVFEPPRATLVTLRLLSAAFGALTTWLTYKAAREIPGISARTSIVAAMFVASLPTYVGTTASVNNDGLVTLLSAVCIVLMFRHSFTVRTAMFAGLVGGLAISTKTNAVVLLPLLFLCLIQSKKGWRDFAVTGVAIVVGVLPGLMLAVAKNITVTGSALVLNTQVQQHWSFSISSLFWALRNIGWSFWLAFGRTYGITAPPFVYIATIVPLVGAAGVGLWNARRLYGTEYVILFSGVFLALIASLYYSLSYPPGTATSWGKNLYPVLPMISILLAIGWENALRGKPAVTYAGLFLMVMGCGWAAYRLATL